VAFIDAVKFPPKAKQAHEHLRAAMEEALARKNWFLVQTDRPIEDCGDSPECLASVAKSTATQYVLRISGQKTRDVGYDVTLDVFTTAAGYSRSSHATCDMCDPASMSEIASGSAVELLTSVLKEEANLREKAKRATVRPPIAAQVPSPPPPAALVMPPPVPVAEPASRSWIPWTLIGVGAVAVVYGGWAIHEDGQTGSCSPTAPGLACDRTSSNTRGIVSLVGGGLMAAAGVIWILATPTHTTTLTASPNHVALNVRF
jgi:hypothetical protein